MSPAKQINRARQLDALAAVLPIAAVDRYAEVLTDADVATLKHLADTGIGANTLRALASDLAYLEAWCRAATARSEVATLRRSQISSAEPISPRPTDAASPTAPCIRIALGRTTAITAGQGELVFAAGRATVTLEKWMQFAKITTDLIFRKVRKDESIGSAPRTLQSVNHILKMRCLLAGLDPTEFSAHRLRSGFMTQAGRGGVPLVDAMRQSTHKSVQQAAKCVEPACQD